MTTVLALIWAIGYFLLLIKAARLSRDVDFRIGTLLFVVLFMALWPLWSLGLVGVWMIGARVFAAPNGDVIVGVETKKPDEDEKE